jgi:hypothetical protein
LEKTDQRKQQLDSALRQVTREAERVPKWCGCALLALVQVQWWCFKERSKNNRDKEQSW